jgi:hypothetical protein
MILYYNILYGDTKSAHELCWWYGLQFLFYPNDQFLDKEDAFILEYMEFRYQYIVIILVFTITITV